MPKSGLTYGVDITSRSQLIDALNSQRVFFDDAAKLHELEPSANPFLTMLMGGPNKRKAAGDLESYVEHRGSYIKDPMFFLNAMTDPQNLGAANAGAAIAGIKLAASAGGSKLASIPLTVGDVIVLVNPLDTTQTASILIGAVDAADEVSGRLLTDTPGFNAVANTAGATMVMHVGRAFGEGSAESSPRFERPVTCWNEIGSFKESFSITDQLAANSQIVYGNEQIKQLNWAQMRIMRDVDRMLLYASQRLNATNPYSAPGSSPITDAAGNIIRTSISMEQAIRSAGDVGLGGSRVFKNTAATLDPDTFDGNMTEAYRYGSANKVCFAGAGFISDLIAMARRTGQYVMETGDKRFGLDFRTFVTPIADMTIVYHRGMQGRLDRAMFMLDMDNIQLRQLIPLYTEPLVTNSTKKAWELRWDIGLRVYLPESHSLWFMV